MKKINSIPAKTSTAGQAAQLSRSFLAPFPLLTSRVHPSRHVGLSNVGLENLEAKSSLCLRPHTLFILPCSEFWDYRSSQLCLQLDMEKGNFTILWSCSKFTTLPCLSHCLFLTSLYHLNCSSMCNTAISTPDCSVQPSRSWCLTTSAKFSAMYVPLAGDFLDNKHL